MAHYSWFSRILKFFKQFWSDLDALDLFTVDVEAFERIHMQAHNARIFALRASRARNWHLNIYMVINEKDSHPFPSLSLRSLLLSFEQPEDAAPFPCRCQPCSSIRARALGVLPRHYLLAKTPVRLLAHIFLAMFHRRRSLLHPTEYIYIAPIYFFFGFLQISAMNTVVGTKRPTEFWKRGQNSDTVWQGGRDGNKKTTCMEDIINDLFGLPTMRSVI